MVRLSCVRHIFIDPFITSFDRWAGRGRRGSCPFLEKFDRFPTENRHFRCSQTYFFSRLRRALRLKITLYSTAGGKNKDFGSYTMRKPFQNEAFYSAAGENFEISFLYRAGNPSNEAFCAGFTKQNTSKFADFQTPPLPPAPL